MWTVVHGRLVLRVFRHMEGGKVDFSTEELFRWGLDDDRSPAFFRGEKEHSRRRKCAKEARPPPVLRDRGRTKWLEHMNMEHRGAAVAARGSAAILSMF